ncbi:uncharacterized protein JN550_008692 [Neoarthrinium moseri]|uniref:uncharacterized protein n=1 Tax=Neoarthrinium moseri TaxID=1658444 RepID=UPI001FDC5255|nr:uncharacterized protein JN550_008692 [Neoarthrinium moseri]KAI1864872.1 hypothetical protein JN550_008692 [Neoarthrinium moseri]
MFDVYWTDHNRELVGERATRKEREEREGKSRERSSQKKQENARHSVSTNGSASSERSFGLFSSRKKFTTLGRLDLTSTSSEPATDATKERGISAYGVKRLLSHQESPGATVKPMNAEDLPVQQPEPIDVADVSRWPDSVTSKWTQPSLATSSTLEGSSPRSSIATRSEHLVQTLGPSSFILKTTQVVVGPRNSDTDVNHLISEVHISSDGVKAATPPLPDLPEEGHGFLRQ